ncbi:MAG: hypothetical protein VB083_02160 [Aminobacterium sp.]|jgi:hypothetical protein|uniref:hypothetical protein n=1 Tax=Aminobacterium sp. TaxID=1872491 RepID=UPI002B21E9A9|nr:hypothetical protein [Aminobacterium sp.]MDD2206854.1 hypothetical protein [Aminobacterium sp.]MEA4876691.1 hypothetical protein [Aminobacterium sp.]
MPDFEDYAGFKKTQGSEKFERYKLKTNRLVLIAATCDHINDEESGYNRFEILRP